MDNSVRQYLQSIGRKGGAKSKRILSTSDAKNMVRLREARRAYKQFMTQCFWSFDPNYKISYSDIDWVIEQLKKNGSRKAWEVATRLCR
jgi:hypothetical protein